MKILITLGSYLKKKHHADTHNHGAEKFSKTVKRAYKLLGPLPSELKKKDGDLPTEDPTSKGLDAATDPLTYMKQYGGEWATYQYNDFLDTKIKDNEVLKDQFVAYISGWLQYYDEISRNNGIDHLAYFDWGTNSVTVYLAPPPGSADKPITPPAGRTSSDPQDPSSPPPPYPEPSTT